VLRPQRGVVRQVDRDAVRVLREPHHLTAAHDPHTELLDPSAEDALEVALPQREPVRVAGGEVADDCRPA
jgi:hypothetical protein